MNTPMKPDAASKKKRAKKKGEGTRAGGAEVPRMLRLVELVRSRGWVDREEVASELGVDMRSVYRYVNKLRDAGIAIEAKRGGYELDGESFLPPLQLTADEALSLMALCQSPAAREQLSMLGALERVVSKLTEQLPKQMKADVKGMLDSVVIQTAPGADSEIVADVYARVKTAIGARKLLACEYDKRGGVTSEFHLEPYALYFGVRAWYVIGRHVEKQEVRTLRLSRFLKVEVLEETYGVPRSFSIEKYFGNAWTMVRGKMSYKVELIFTEALSETISETRWHKTQEIEALEDGTVRFRCEVDGLDEIVWWVMSMGASCRVEQPMELRLRVREQAERIVELYSKRRGKKGDEEAELEPGEVDEAGV